MSKVIVIGSGLFGGTIAHAMQRAGHEVVVIDDARPMAGSRPSGCLMKPSWFAGLGKEVYEPSLKLLESVYGLQDLEFDVWPTRLKQRVHRVEPHLNGLTVIKGTVTAMSMDKVVEFRTDFTSERHTMMADIVVVAAGVWCSQIMGVQGLVGKVGVSFVSTGQIERNLIKPWAPFKQLVAFNVPNKGEIWVGDGSAIVEKNWNVKTLARSSERCQPFVGMNVEARVGIRPYHPDAKPCLLEQRSAGLWLATGGAKNGTIAAGWAAYKIVEAS